MPPEEISVKELVEPISYDDWVGMQENEHPPAIAAEEEEEEEEEHDNH